MSTMSSIESQLRMVGQQVSTQSLTAIVAGFSFATAIAWMDVVRFLISNVVKVNKNGGSYYLLSALLTTLLSIVVYMIINKVSKGIVKRPRDVSYAVTA
jgi:hypothetical protein